MLKRLKKGSWTITNIYYVSLKYSAKCHFYFRFCREMFLTNISATWAMFARREKIKFKKSNKKHQMRQNCVKLINLLDSRIY